MKADSNIKMGIKINSGFEAKARCQIVNLSQ